MIITKYLLLMPSSFFGVKATEKPLGFPHRPKCPGETKIKKPRVPKANSFGSPAVFIKDP
jgi:hypothetical protein